MNRAEYLLVQAGSECNEVAHRASKALHFGVEEIEPGQGLTNAQRMAGEFVDLLAVMEMLEEQGLVSIPVGAELDALVAIKKAKVEKYIRYAAQQCGTVSE